jgi:hypothetical protein
MTRTYRKSVAAGLFCLGQKFWIARHPAPVGWNDFEVRRTTQMSGIHEDFGAVGNDDFVSPWPRVRRMLA